MEITDRTTVAQRLAETYEGGRYDTGEAWERVQEYQAMQEYCAENPNAGSYAVASHLDVPRSRVRPWMDDGAKPDPVRAVEVAEEYDWLDLTPGEPPFSGLNVCVAWVFAGGSIATDTFVPYFSAEPQEQPCIETALHTANVTRTRVTRPDEDNRATEVTPREAASVFGRLLHALGAPLGTKHAARDLALPPYLSTTPRETRLAFARTYVWLRGTPRDDRPQTPVQLREERSEQYRRQLMRLFDDLAGDAVRGEAETFRLSAEAAMKLDQPPSVCADVP